MPPTMLIDSLNSIRRRVKLFGVVMGVGVVVAAAVGLLLGTILLDYLLNLQSWPRFVVMTIAVWGIGYVLTRWLIKPALARLSLGDVAGRLEHAFPQFDDRLRSTVDFVQGNIPGSDMMKDRVVTQTMELARQVDLNRAIVMTPVWYSMAAGFGAILLVALLAVTINPQYTRIALSRLFMPFGGERWPRSVQIDLVGDVPTRVPVGQKVDIRMRLSKGDRASTKAIIFYQYDGGGVQQQYMQRGADGTYAASLDAMPDLARAAARGNASMKVWMKAGDDEKYIEQPITIVPRLAIQSADVIVTPPKYANLPPVTFNLVNGPAVMVVGSDAALRFGFNKPLNPSQPLSLEILATDAKPLSLQWEHPSVELAVANYLATTSVRFHIHATDTDGFQNPGLEEYELIVRPDQNPTVQIENPRRNEERTAAATVPLAAIADDDYGIKSLKLMVDRLGDKKHWEIPLIENAAAVDGVTWAKADSGADRQRFAMSYTWDLSKLAAAELKSGDVLEYYCEVRDNFELNGETHSPVPSGKLRITIISQEELTNRLTDELRTVAGQVNDVRNSQIRTKDETANLAADTKKKDKLDDADRAAVERLANQQSTAASQAKQIAGKLDAMLNRMDENKSQAAELKDIATDVKNQLNDAAEKPMKDAVNQLNDAKDPKAQPQPRDDSLSKAQANQQSASDQLQHALDRMGNIGSLQQTIDKIREILKDQQRVTQETAEAAKNNLGKTPEQMNPEDRAKLDKAAKEQGDLSKRTEKALADMQKVGEQMSKSDPTSSEAMKNAAKTGQQQQVPSQQSKASQMAQQNQQAGAQAAQKQAELGLEMMLGQLREAERRKLEELAKKLADIQQQIANLIRRQSGHNLDNLGLQGADRIKKVEANLLKDLLEQAERTPEQLAQPSPLPQLNTGQEQTERNTRDIAKSVEELPNGTESAAHLTRAASKMERAIVSLRQSKLPDAYDPPQVEALAALQDAKKRIDEEMRKVQDKQNESERETIRQAYEKIKQDQEKLNQETTQVDSSPRAPDGTLLKREDVLHLAKLPGEQGGLADRTEKIEEGLSAAGGVIYVWANKDIVNTMNGVKDDLGKNVTGKPTQAEQTRIVEQLDAMIRNLATKPPDQKFAARNNGGGAGGAGQGAPPLPSEAELKLLKELQQAVNKSTKTIDALPQKDKTKLLALGNRQGEFRNVLDQMLQKASHGQMKLGPEPDNKDQLPEEANAEQVENQELDQNLLNDKPDAEKTEKTMNLVGDRMARSRQRLALNSDPGKVTQIIQDRILKDIDDLIDQSRKQQQQASAQPKPGQGQQQKSPPKPGQGNPQNANANGRPKPNTGQTPAANSNSSGAAQARADTSQDIREKMSEWGGTSPRERAAVIEGAGETVIEKYKNLIDDYYRSLATKSSERQ